MVNENKDWEKPELIVLVRNKPEEAVLEACKISGYYSVYASDDAFCNVPGECSNCESTSAS